ncbi:uncharacterized protein LOC135847941 [Planococcus citri]|uniref:uncharacterized protein LOC135847941 n=1 Tax=Planococcus citri TaxID=170843 RepID=UPI0031F90A10
MLSFFSSLCKIRTPNYQVLWPIRPSLGKKHILAIGSPRFLKTSAPNQRRKGSDENPQDSIIKLLRDEVKKAEKKRESLKSQIKVNRHVAESYLVRNMIDNVKENHLQNYETDDLKDQSLLTKMQTLFGKFLNDEDNPTGKEMKTKIKEHGFSEQEFIQIIHDSYVRACKFFDSARIILLKNGLFKAESSESLLSIIHEVEEFSDKEKSCFKILYPAFVPSYYGSLGWRSKD